ncbi:MAG: signal recognition particle-docking protein FtsY [Gammaproteobacteria bacterium]|nr:signal recognition particle-docking protein FtsY [Gammaproteobacteria bacterium]
MFRSDKRSQDGDAPAEKREGLFSRLKKGLSRTRGNLTEGLATLVRGNRAVDDDLLEELETLLLTSDVGVEATRALVDNLSRRVARKELKDADVLYETLRQDMLRILNPVTKPIALSSQRTRPFVVLMVGVNGAGKTTTIGKLAKRFQSLDLSVMLAAGDTFRAAAVEQLQAWGERNDVPVVAQQTGADAASVIYDALDRATARGIDVLIADTAGRLHTQDNLMEELKKVKRVLGKIDPEAPHEVLLVLDATAGQNALAQARQFHQAVGVTGIVLTKLDGTAKGGIVFALAKELGLPLRYIGVGEGIEDMRPFKGAEFIDALFARE